MNGTEAAILHPTTAILTGVIDTIGDLFPQWDLEVCHAEDGKGSLSATHRRSGYAYGLHTDDGASWAVVDPDGKVTGPNSPMPALALLRALAAF